MGVLMSRNEKIDGFRIEPIPTRPARVRKIVRIDKTIVALLEDGTVVSNHGADRWAYPASMKSFHWMHSLTQALCKLGLISKDDQKKHIDHCEKRDRVSEVKWAEEHLQANAEKLGIKLTKAQKTKIASAKSSAKAALT